MSWSVEGRGAINKIRTILNDKFWKTYPNPGGEILDQFVTTLIAVPAIIASLFPSETEEARNKHEVAVNLSGHANPAHRPREGYSNDFISISVSQL